MQRSSLTFVGWSGSDAPSRNTCDPPRFAHGCYAAILAYRGRSFTDYWRIRVASRAISGASVFWLHMQWDRPEIWGIMPLWQRPDRHWRPDQIDAQTQHRAFRCRPRNELAAADRRLF